MVIRVAHWLRASEQKAPIASSNLSSGSVLRAFFRSVSRFLMLLSICFSDFCTFSIDTLADFSKCISSSWKLSSSGWFFSTVSTRKWRRVDLLSRSLVLHNLGRYDMSKPTDSALREPVFMMLPMRRMISRSLPNFLLLRTSSQAAVAATMSGLQSWTNSG